MNEEAVEFDSVEDGTIILSEEISEEKLKVLTDKLNDFGIEIKSKDSFDLVNEIKLLIKKMVQNGITKNVKMSDFLSTELGFSYPYLSNQFSIKTYTSIENFYILVRIEKVKEMVLLENAKLSEIAYELNFSSVPHLSNQFKKVTGLTITQYLKFRKIMDNNSATNS